LCVETSRGRLVLQHKFRPQLGAVLGAGSNRVVVALDADPAGQQAAARAYTGLTAHGLDPRAAVLLYLSLGYRWDTPRGGTASRQADCSHQSGHRGR